MPAAEQIRTRRFLLAPVTESDAHELHEIWTGPGVRRYLFDDEILSAERTSELIRESLRLARDEATGLWGVRPAAGDRLIGFTGLWYFRDPPERELLYGVAEEAWGRGVASEVASAMLGYGFERLRLAAIVASTDSANAASVRVMEKIGMTFLRRDLVEGLDTVYYVADRESWLERCSTSTDP